MQGVQNFQAKEYDGQDLQLLKPMSTDLHRLEVIKLAIYGTGRTCARQTADIEGAALASQQAGSQVVAQALHLLLPAERPAPRRRI
jgi:hypothetical protein